MRLTPTGRGRGRGVALRLRRQHTFMPAGDASLTTAQVNQKNPLTAITVSTAITEQKGAYAPFQTNQRAAMRWWISSHTRGGDSGSSRGSTPSEPSAAATALAITPPTGMMPPSPAPLAPSGLLGERSEEHTSELQSLRHL